MPLRSHGSLSLNRALMAAGLVDRLQVTVFPVITGQTGLDPIFQGAADFDLELIESQSLDDNTQELIYRPYCTSESVRCPRPRPSDQSRRPIYRPTTEYEGSCDDEADDHHRVERFRITHGTMRTHSCAVTPTGGI